jgi:flagellar hook-basal body complex protein FliE
MNSINAIGFPAAPEKPGAPAKAAEVGTSFLDTMKQMLASVNDSQVAGDQAVEQLQSGDAQHLHEVMLAVEEADISLRMLVQVRNKALTAYEEIMRMQI